MRILFFSAKSYDQEYFTLANEAFGYELSFIEAPLSQQTLSLSQGYEAICVFVNDKLDAAVLEGLAQKGVKVVALRCAGFNNVDLTAAAKLGITVLRVPAYSPEAVAEHAVALILTLSRKTHKAYNRVRESNFSLERLTGFNLYQKTIGVVGTGKIGQAFCRIMQGFGCRLLAYDLYPNEEMQSLGVEYVSFTRLLEQSDVISLHCPLTPDTHHLLDAQAFGQIKKGATLINTSRGGLIDTAAVIQALKHAQIRALGIDVYEQEEHLFFRDLSETIIQDDLIARLMSFPNVLVTAHQAFFTQEALTEIAQISLSNLSAWQQGAPLANEVKDKA
ncbi:MAG: 2-hydroxyacid dehydrogenase [Bacteroidota bacterium]